jgi:hypothetical protein
MAHARPTDVSDPAAPLPSQPDAIAHDFNNVLGSMMGWIHLARRKTTDPDIDALLERALAAGERGQRLTRRLLQR